MKILKTSIYLVSKEESAESDSEHVSESASWELLEPFEFSLLQFDWSDIAVATERTNNGLENIYKQVRKVHKIISRKSYLVINSIYHHKKRKKIIHYTSTITRKCRQQAKRKENYGLRNWSSKNGWWQKEPLKLKILMR